ncbi:MAG: hypothetical protein KDD89_04660 [Anaerolineales bacterium]|nr:hypothetical protein [Anaerolineales bacterium]
MFDLSISGILSTVMLMAGDILALITAMIPAVVVGGLLFSAVGQVKFTEVIRYWVIGLILTVFLGFAIMSKASNPLYAADPNGLIFGFSNNVVLWLWGASLLFLVGSLGLLVYILNK